MNLFVANCTRQNAMLNYRVVEMKSPFVQPCDAGQQIMIARDRLNMPQVQNLMEQLQAIGGWAVEEIEAVSKDRLVYWLWSIDKPVSEDRIRMAMAHNRLVQFTEGKEFRQRAAIATHSRIAQTTPHAADTLDVSIQEEIEGGQTGVGGDPAVADGYRFDPNRMQ